MIEELKKLQELRDGYDMGIFKVLGTIKEHPIGVGLLWLELGVLGMISLYVLFNIGKKLNIGFMKSNMNKINKKINSIDSNIDKYSSVDENNLLSDKSNVKLFKNKLEANRKKRERLVKLFSLLNKIKNKSNRRVLDGQDIVLACLPGVLVSFIFVMNSFLISEYHIDKTTDFKNKSIEVYNEEIKNYPVNSMLVMRLSKIGMNKYNLIYKNGTGTVVEKQFEGKIIETEEGTGVKYEFNYYPYPEEFKGTYFERNDDKLTHGHGVKNEVIKISKENMKIINGKSEYINENYSK